MAQRVTQSRTLTASTSSARGVTRAFTLVATVAATSPQVTQTRALALTRQKPPVRATQIRLLSAGFDKPVRRTTQIRALAGVHEVVDLTWRDCIKSIRLPECLSEGVVGGPNFFTEEAQAVSSHTNRVQRWRQARAVYALPYDLLSLEELHALIAFWRIVRGRAHAFLLKDLFDYASSDTLGRDVQPVAPTDQFLGVGDAIRETFQLRKGYTFDGETAWRTITKPVAGTVRVAINGIEVANWSVNTQTGMVTFLPRHEITASDLSVSDDGTCSYLESAATDLSGFQAGDAIQVQGFTGGNVYANTKLKLATGLDETYSVAAVLSPTRVQLTNTRGRTAAAGDPVTVRVHPAPRNLDQVTAGFEFDVPLRFNTDELPMTLDSAGLGALSEIELVEVV